MFLNAFAQRPGGFPDITLMTVLTLQTINSPCQLIWGRFVLGRYEQLAKSLVWFEGSMYPRFLISSAYLIRDALNIRKSRKNSPLWRPTWIDCRSGLSLPTTVRENPVLISTVFQSRFDVIFSTAKSVGSVTVVSALCISVRTTLILCSRGW